MCCIKFSALQPWLLANDGKHGLGEEVNERRPRHICGGAHFCPCRAWYSYSMSESLEGMAPQRVESAREQHEREAARAIAAEYRALLSRADDRMRAEPVFRRVESASL